MQSIIIAILAIVIALSALTYHQLDQTYYIIYNETSSVDYKVHLAKNDFYEEEWLGKDHSYVASLIDGINATFEYTLNMDTANVDYEYSYGIDAQLLIADKQTGHPLYNPTTIIKPETVNSQSSNKKLRITENVVIDYVYFNKLASDFVSRYDLRDVNCSLAVTMKVAVKGSCNEFENDSTNKYNVALSIPLTSRTVDIEITSSVPTAEGKVIACSTGIDREIFKKSTIIFTVLDAILIAVLIVFIYLTRNEDINYSIRVKKILSNYRSYIQKINNEFNTEGYQILAVSSFEELLGIRDTIQSPILMEENADKTLTKFFIPTSTKILYVHEIKVDDYDKIYGLDSEMPISITLNVDEEASTVEATTEPDEAL